MKAQLLALFYVLLVAFAMPGCHSMDRNDLLQERQAQSRPRPATYGSDGFYNEIPYPLDPTGGNPPDFFFKRCSLRGRYPAPSTQDWDCTEPR